MVECYSDQTVRQTMRLDNIFSSLADPTRRDILSRLMRGQLSVNEIAEPYSLTLAAISKHVKILERAKLVIKRRQGKQQIVSLSPVAFKDASIYLQHYEAIWSDRFDALEELLKD